MEKRDKIVDSEEMGAYTSFWYHVSKKHYDWA